MWSQWGTIIDSLWFSLYKVPKQPKPTYNAYRYIGGQTIKKRTPVVTIKTRTALVSERREVVAGQVTRGLWTLHSLMWTLVTWCSFFVILNIGILCTLLYVCNIEWLFKDIEEKRRMETHNSEVSLKMETPCSWLEAHFHGRTHEQWHPQQQFKAFFHRRVKKLYATPLVYHDHWSMKCMLMGNKMIQYLGWGALNSCLVLSAWSRAFRNVVHS